MVRSRYLFFFFFFLSPVFFSTALRFARRWYCYDARVGDTRGRFERNAEEIEGIEMCCGLRLIVGTLLEFVAKRIQILSFLQSFLEILWRFN